jgi:hypothetical protein
MRALTYADTSKISLLLSKLTSPDLAATIRTSVHADPIGWFDSCCAGDAAWLYLSMSFSASRLRQQRDTDGLESTEYLSKSISIINEHLVDPLMRASGSTIATVACLANIEVSIPFFFSKVIILTYPASQWDSRERSSPH